MKQFCAVAFLLFSLTQKDFAQTDTSTVFTVAIDENSAAYNKIGTRFSFTKMSK